jgi:hypothetical protein
MDDGRIIPVRDESRETAVFCHFLRVLASSRALKVVPAPRKLAKLVNFFINSFGKIFARKFLGDLLFKWGILSNSVGYSND